VSAYIEEHRERFGVEPICRILEVSASAYYERRRGRRSARAISDERLLERIREVHERNCSVGDAYDNAMAESLVDTFKTELIADRVWRSRSQLELAVVEYIACLNNDRLHESLGDLSPAEFESLCVPQEIQLSNIS
jgi:hypothetical protein